MLAPACVSTTLLNYNPTSALSLCHSPSLHPQNISNCGLRTTQQSIKLFSVVRKEAMKRDDCILNIRWIMIFKENCNSERVTGNLVNVLNGLAWNGQLWCIISRLLKGFTPAKYISHVRFQSMKWLPAEIRADVIPGAQAKMLEHHPPPPRVTPINFCWFSIKTRGVPRKSWSCWWRPQSAKPGVLWKADFLLMWQFWKALIHFSDGIFIIFV